jgi:hypothetical protein
MVLRKFILGAAAVALTASTAVAGGLDAAGTEDDEVGAIVAGPTGTLGAAAAFGGLSTATIVGATAGVIVLGTVVANTVGDDDDDGGTNGTPTTPN